MPKVSVVIPCFNQGQFVDEAVASVLAQTCRDFEIIIINDGSTDEATNRKLAAYEHPKVQVIRTANQGTAGARNTGIAAADSPYILPLDADDKIAETYLEKALAVLEADPRVGIVYCKARLFGLRSGEWQLPEYRLSGILVGNMIFNSAFFRRTDWQATGGYNLNMNDGLEDHDFWLSLIEMGREVYRIPEVLFYYRRHEGSRNERTGEHLIDLYTQLFKNHPRLYSENIHVVFEQMIVARREAAEKIQAIEQRDQRLTYLLQHGAEQLQQIASLLAEKAQWSSARAAAASRNAEMETEITALSAKLTAQQQEAERLTANLNEQRRAAQQLAAQIEEREWVIRVRDASLEKLHGELQNSQMQNQQLDAANRLLQEAAARRTRHSQMLAAQLADKEAQLTRIVNTLGWRLLSLYGPIKYRYLLPLYRKFGLPPFNTKNAEAADANAERLRIDEPPDASLSELIGEGLGELTREAGPFDRVGLPANGGGEDLYESLTLLPHIVEEQLPAAMNQLPAAAPRRRADIICFSIIDWEFRYQRPQQIMSQFAAHGHRVFYISTTRFQSAKASPRVHVIPIRENVYEVQLAADHPPDVYGEVVEGSNQTALMQSLDELRRTYHIDEAIGYVMIPSWGSLALAAGRHWNWQIIYDCMDEWDSFPGIKRALIDMESTLVRGCDLLVVTAQRLYEKWQDYKRPTVLARNAADFDFYAKRYRPNALLKDVNHPVIGYYGAIADWFDIDLLAYAARQRPDYTFVLLGGVFDVDVSELERLPNVRLLGQQPYETMPQYLYHFDACMIPFKVNAITEATDPVKVYEYLSAGKPVVAVALPELEPLREHLYIAKDRREFIAQIDQAVAEDDADMVARRRHLAKQHTWAARYRQIAAGITQVTPRASIIVVTYNNLALTRLCLESLIRNTEYPNYEVIVVDNHSADGTASYLRYMAARHSHIQIILNRENAGFARANNQGIERSTGDALVLLNNDTIVPPGWLSRLLRHLENEAVGMVGPMTNFVGNEAKLEVPYRTWAEMEQFAQAHTWANDGRVADIHMLAMFCVAFRRRTYEQIGPLDEQFGIGMFEDDDYALRIKAHGLRVICAADVFVHHFGQAAFKKLIESGQYNPLFDENRRRYETKWNVEWVPHKHAPLTFKPLAVSRAVEGSKS